MHFNRVKEASKWIGETEEKLGLDNLSWRKRTVVLFSFVEDTDYSFMDLGAGKMFFGKLLDSNCVYLPVDYYKSGPNTIVCDFNKGEFPDQHVDVVIASGILGYIDNLEWFLDKICNSCRKILLSFRGAEKYKDGAITTQELIEYLHSKGFSITKKDDSLEDWSIIASFEKITPANLGYQISCVGCGACVQECGRGALSLEFDDDGYYKPYFDEKKCSHCNRCLEKCQILHPIKNSNYIMPRCYAAWATDDIRLVSSSGGAFSVIANYFIQNGGIVFGAAWNDDFSLSHISAETQSELPKLRRSKYLQSNTENTFQKVKENLIRNRMVAYFGTPCQIAGLKHFLYGTETKLLLMIDVFCIGVPSARYFKKYLDENYSEELVDIKFRYKRKLGWNARGFCLTTKSGKDIEPHPYVDAYQTSLHSTLFRNDCCEDCDYAGFPREGDISIGDFWGIDKYRKDWNDRKGTSCILVNNEKAQNYLQTIIPMFSRIEEVPLSYCVDNGNRVGTGLILRNERRHTFSQLIKKYSYVDSTRKALYGEFDIALVVMSNENFGNLLTNYSLYEVLKESGFSVCLVTDQFKDKASISTKIAAHYLKLPYSINDLFQPNGEKLNLLKLNDTCKTFILGSDQVLLDRYIESTEYFSCMDWVRGDRKKIAYGPSLDLSHFDMARNTKKIEYLLNRFDYFSVRESEGQIVLRERLGVHADVVLDPLFLCDKSCLCHMASYGQMRFTEQDYVGAYLLNREKDAQDAIQDLSIYSTGGHYYAITTVDYLKNSDDILDFMTDPAVEEWVSLIQNSKFIITDSYHGMCLSIVFRKQFCVIYDSEKYTGIWRFNDLLGKLGLKHRLLTSYDKESLIELYKTNIDYDAIYQILNKEISKSKKWLVEAVMQQNDNEYSAADQVMDLMYKEYVRRDLDERRVNKEFVRLSKKMTENERKIRQKYEQKIREKRAEIFILGKENSIKRQKYNQLNIICWGAGDLFMRKIDELTKYHNVFYVCDSDSKKWGTEVKKGIKCISPNQLSEFDDVFVIITIDNIKISFDIVDELLKMGITNFSHIRNWLSYVERGI